MTIFTNRRENSGKFPFAGKVVFRPIPIGCILAGIALVGFISQPPVNIPEAGKFYILLIVFTLLMLMMIILLFQNISTRVNSEARLQKSIKDISDYKLALDESAIVAITDQKGIILHVNNNFCRISKYSREELIGQDHRIINSGHHSKEFIRQLWITIANGRIWRGEFMNKAKNGTTYWVDTTIVPFLDGNGKPYQYVSIRWDITERKKAEEAEKKSMANLCAIIEHTDSGIYSLDVHHRFIAFNRTFSDTIKRVYGLEINQGDPAFDVLEKLKPKEAQNWMDIYARALKGETIKFEKEFNLRNFKSFVSFSIHPIWRNSIVIGLSCFTRDVTEQKREEAKYKQMTADLIQRNKDLEQFSYVVSHNLRGPVATILGLSNIIKEVGLSRKEEEKTRDYLFKTVNQLDAVIKDLNQTFEVKRNIHEAKEEIVFSEIAEGITFSLESCIEKRKARIITDFSEAESMFSIRSYIQNVFYNLISNSLKYARPEISPVIVIKSEKREDKLFLYFRDNGLGIDMELCRTKVFGLYHRFHPGTDGKGMGLFMVKTQVEAMGGEVSLKSVVNKGTELTLEFPISP